MFKGKILILILLFSFISELSNAQLLSASLRKNDVDEVYNDAVQLVNAKRYKEALPLAQKAVDRYPNNPDYNLLMGRLHILMNKPQLARPYIIKTLNKAPTYKDAYYYAIKMELDVNNTNQAIAYANRAIMRFPNDVGFAVKRLGIYDQIANYAAGDAIALELLQKYPSSNEVKNAWVGHHEAAGAYYKSKGMLSQAQFHFEEALKVAPDNKEAKDILTSISMKSLTPQEALAKINASLDSSPNSYDLLMKKLGLQMEMHEYSDATATIKKLKASYPGDSKVRQMELELKLTASRYYEHTDPYVLYQSVLESNPGNREALDKLIGISMDRGVYRNALDWINQGLKSSPNDFILLSKKADVLEFLDNKLGAAEIVYNLWMRNPTSEDLRSRASELKVAAGKYYLGEKQFEKGLAEFEMALNIDPSNIDAVTNIANIYIEQKDYENAISALNMALQYREDDESLLLKKSSVLADAGKYNEAFPVIGKLIELYPNNPRYSSILTDQQMQAGRLLMNENEMEEAANQFKRALLVSPNNKDALTYIINLESGMNRPDSALAYVAKGLDFYPNDKDFLLKKVAVLSDQKKNKDAYIIASGLMKEYPYNKSYRAAYMDNVMLEGYKFQKDEKYEQALAEFQKVLVLSPYDTNALYASVNLMNATDQNDTALALIDRGLKYYGDNNPYLLRQQAIAYAAKNDYKNAVDAAEKLAKIQPNEKNIDYADFIKASLAKNQFALFYHQSSYNRTSLPFRIISLEYRRFLKKASIAGRVNFGTKNSGAALQFEGDAIFNHTKTLYTNVNVAYSNNKNIFPTFKAGISIYKGWGKDWETEIGGRYLRVQTGFDSTATFLSGSETYMVTQQSSMFSGVIGISKGIDDFWFNARAFFTFDVPEATRNITSDLGTVTEDFSDEQRFYQSYKFTARYYMNSRKEILYLIGGLGTSPDDRVRVVQIPQLSGSWLNQSVAVGYRKTFKYQTTLDGSIGWSNNKIGLGEYIGQYDVYLALIKKF